MTSEATTLWFGDLTTGNGTTSLDTSDSAEVHVAPARSQEFNGRSNPEELLGAAHSSCFAMTLSGALTRFGTPPESLQVTAVISFDPGATISGSHLLVSARVAGISDEDFQRLAVAPKETCPLSLALTGITVTLEASLA